MEVDVEGVRVMGEERAWAPLMHELGEFAHRAPSAGIGGATRRRGVDMARDRPHL
jgi:hypothetical protein